jgi:apolipoprotein N-acyltransferase
VPLFFALRNKSKVKAFLLGCLTGIIFWLGTIYWLIHVTLLGMLLLAIYLSLYFGIFGLIVARTQNLKPITEILFFPSLWVVLEYIRSHLLTGFPWGLLGYSQYLNLPIIQVADITGAWGVSFLVMMVNSAIYSVIGYPCLPAGRGLSVIEKIKKLIIPILCVVLTLIYGFYKIHRTPNTEHRTPIRISVVQGNIPQELKWDARAKEFIIGKYFNLTAEALKDKADLLIWPEASLPVALEQEPEYIERVKDFVKGIGKPLLLGAVTLRGDAYYNSAILVSSKGVLSGRYDKIHLVPFGEYIPLRKIFTFLESIVPICDLEAGKEYTIFTLKAPHEQASFSTLICFEDVFPELSRQFVKKGARLLINITNDAWFKETSAPYQHLQCSVFRAVENRVPLVRSANTGVSAFIAPTGKVIAKVTNAARDIFVDGHVTEEILIMDSKLSFYTRYGDVFILACLIYSLSYWGVVVLKR